MGRFFFQTIFIYGVIMRLVTKKPLETQNIWGVLNEKTHECTEPLA